jgi:glyoxylase-like metal-dependent hydrolase (beta-lactamase superfamily II)
MKLNKCMALALVVFLAAVSCADQEEFPFRINRISDRVMVFTPGLYATPAVTNVIVTEEGLILVDTGLSPTLAEMTRRKIRKELGRDDVLLVINTHHHFDHTDGNQVYTGAEIIGHTNTAAAMEQFIRNKESFIEGRRGRIARMREDLDNASPESEEALRAAEGIRMEEIFIQDLLTDFSATPPTSTLDDRLDLNRADLEIRFYAFGQAHTDTDILVHIPSLGVLFVGDLFHPDYLSVTAGSGPLDVPRWLEVLETVLTDEANIKTVIGGHGHIYTRKWLAAQARYVRDAWTAVTEAQDQGGTIADVLAANPLLPDYSYMESYFDLAADEVLTRHLAVIQAFWRVNLKSASEEIYSILDQSGPEAARERFRQIRAEPDEEYYLDEREFNALGYQLLRERKIAPAIAVFTMNTQAFPQSWNVWDSLAEAYLWSGDDDKSEEYYRKSLALNPESVSGRNALSRFDGYRLDIQMQTAASSLFEAGAQSGLQEPYLGQKPPGIKPEIFAPGIVSLGGNWEFSITFSPDGKEIYFTRRKEDGGRNTIMVSRLEKEGWTAPEEAAFAEGYPSNEPSITPDGDTLYYGSNRPQPGSEQISYGIWKAKRTETGWGKAIFHGPGMYVSSDHSGNLYMTDVSRIFEGGGLIRYPFEDKVYGSPERLPDAINAVSPVDHGFIAPDGSFLIFDASNRPGSQGGEGDLYVSFKNPDGSWGEAQNLGNDINTPGTDFCPSLSPDGKYLFFAAHRDIYWVSAEVIHRLKPVDQK